MADQAFEREPVMWTSTRPDYNKSDRERQYLRDGRVITERIPQTGSQGEYDNRTPITHVRRWLPMINHGGHQVSTVFTNAAADLNNAGPFAQYQWAMIRALGWFWSGACPVALLAAGELAPTAMADQSLLQERPCRPGTYSEREPCKHAKSETAARMARTVQIEAERAAAYTSDNERQIAAQREENTRLINANALLQREMLEANAASQQALIAAMLATKGDDKAKK